VFVNIIALINSKSGQCHQSGLVVKQPTNDSTALFQILPKAAGKIQLLILHTDVNYSVKSETVLFDR
jgi:hypothetical protein